MCRAMVRYLAGAFALILFLPFTALAQQASGIAGLARDMSGSVLPGVTVEAWKGGKSWKGEAAEVGAKT